MNQTNRKLLYLSGAPRVSTTVNAEMGGPKSHILGVINSFRKQGWIVTEFIFGNNFESRVNLNNSDKKLKSNLFIRVLADFYRIFIGIKNQRALQKKYGNQNLKIVYERLSAFQHLGKGLHQKSDTIWVIETNGILFLEGKKDRKGIYFSNICRYFELRAYSHCDFVITISDELKNLIVSNFKINEKKVIVIPNGVDIERFNPENIVAKRIFDQFTIGFVGTLFDWCGLDLLIEAIAEIKEEMRPKLVIVGDGISRKLFEEKVKKKGVDEYVKFIGKQPWEEIPSLIAGFDFCYSGQIETKSGKMYHSPLKIYEYLSMGKPVIASAYADAKSTILDGQNGFLFIPGDKEDLIHVIHRAISSWKSGDFKMQEIRTRLKNEHSWDQRIEFLLEQLKGSL